MLSNNGRGGGNDIFSTSLSQASADLLVMAQSKVSDESQSCISVLSLSSVLVNQLDVAQGKVSDNVRLLR